MKRDFNLLEIIKTKNNYSNEDIKKIKYVLVALSSDISKLLIMGIIFYNLKYFPEYIGSVTILILIRTNSGGLHFYNYITCLLFSLGLIYCSAVILPNLILINRLFIIIDLVVCICISFLLEPVRCVYRPAPGMDLIRRCHINTFKYIFIFLIIAYLLPTNPVILSGFWTINFQMLQLIVANILKGGFCHEENI